MYIIRWIVIMVIVSVIVSIILNILQFPRYQRILNSNYVLKNDRRPNNSKRIVVSLSTTPDRIGLLESTLTSLHDQTLLPDEISLNIPRISRNGTSYNIPSFLKDQNRFPLVKIYRTEKDYGPATKLLPTMKREAPDTRIIVVDDDVIYNSKNIEHLVKVFEKANPEGSKVKTAVSNFGVRVKNGKMLPDLRRVPTAFYPEHDTHVLFGVFGFLVTPEMFPERVYSYKNAPSEAVNVDDVWFSGWILKNGNKIRTSGYMFNKLPLFIKGKMAETVALSKTVNESDENNVKVIKWFGDVFQTYDN